MAKAAVAGVVAAVAAGSYWYCSTGGSEGEDGSSSDTPALTKEQVVEFFDNINHQMGNLVAQLQAQFEQFRGKVRQDQLMQLAAQQFEEGLAKSQQELFDKWDVDEEDMEEATKLYSDDGEVSAGVKKLKNMYRAVTGRASAELPSDLTEAKFLKILGVFFDTSLSVMQGIMDDLKAQGKNMRDPAVLNELNMLYMKLHDPAADKALAPFGLTSDVIPAALEKYQNSPAVAQKVQECQDKQRLQFQAMGLV